MSHHLTFFRNLLLTAFLTMVLLSSGNALAVPSTDGLSCPGFYSGSKCATYEDGPAICELVSELGGTYRIDCNLAATYDPDRTDPLQGGVGTAISNYCAMDYCMYGTDIYGDQFCCGWDDDGASHEISKVVMRGSEDPALDDTIFLQNDQETLRNMFGDRSVHGTALGGGGDDTIVGSRSTSGLYSEDLHGGVGDDTVFGSSGNDVIYGDGDYNLLVGGAGDDVIHCGPDGNEVWGGPDNDEIYGGTSKDVLLGDEDNDQLHGAQGPDILCGGSEADTLWGDSDNDSLFAGGDFGDADHGGAGNDGCDLSEVSCETVPISEPAECSDLSPGIPAYPEYE
jgi:hypothetical protein